MGREGPPCVGRITPRPPGFPRVFDARETFPYLVWRNVTTHASPKYNNSFIERWYIGNGWVYELLFALREKTFDIRGKIPVFL